MAADDPTHPQPTNGKHRAADARKAALIHHAREQVAMHGIQNASLNDIIRLAGGSKATVVKYFGNKAGLFAAAMAATARETMAGLTLDTGGEDRLEPALHSLLRGLLTFYLRPDSLAVYRGVVASADASDGLGDSFYREAHLLVVEEVATFLSKWVGRGIRADIDLHDSAGRLTHMIRSDLYERRLLGLIPLPDETAIARQARITTALFLEGVGKGAAPA
ncbi:TetR/AcrR family transcriptional regulator C-terminal domain-containing protein [Sphingobium sp.]|uniref:TetR/AcrR family transcriptional regulator C-terminal domain-containing protein n=1 Tax=Sphingobium sp. TaxID=1912891 RepID=UPI002CA04DF7|nr:TetR/AcrR family transcriptional regulator C-terminal domain-containing protein [Sphingobium sp.]HUD94714.1 TetR/AcrR family transcriptional regulator C-terminal domain-containing protein [Sphingobium sp.]